MIRQNRRTIEKWELLKRISKIQYKSSLFCWWKFSIDLLLIIPRHTLTSNIKLFTNNINVSLNERNILIPMISLQLSTGYFYNYLEQVISENVPRRNHEYQLPSTVVNNVKHEKHERHVTTRFCIVYVKRTPDARSWSHWYVYKSLLFAACFARVCRQYLKSVPDFAKPRHVTQPLSAKSSDNSTFRRSEARLFYRDKKIRLLEQQIVQPRNSVTLQSTSNDVPPWNYHRCFGVIVDKGESRLVFEVRRVDKVFVWMIVESLNN